MPGEMREPTFWILTALAAGPRHGYAILELVESLSSGSVRLKVATLYAALDRLTKEGLIAPDREETVEGRTRRYFVLTSEGTTRLHEAVDRMELSVSRARSQLKTAPQTFMARG